MTQPVPLEYSGNAGSSDLSRLRILCFCHHVWGGLVIASGCLFLFYGISAVSFAVSHAAPNGQSSGAIDPTVVAIAGTCFLIGVAAATLGVCTVISGSRLSQHRSRRFSLIIAWLNCILFPFGTALGIFTITVLARHAVKKLYDTAALPALS